MILAMILPTRWGSPGLNGRRRTRDWSGLSIVVVRLTSIGMKLLFTGNETRSGAYSSTAIGCLKLVSIFCASRISVSDSKKANVDSAP